MELVGVKHAAMNANNLSKPLQPSWKKMVIARKGLDHIVFHIENIACFYTKDRLVYLLDKEGMKYVVDENLSRLEKELDPSLFFRINRQFIVHIRYIRKFRTFQRLRIQIELNIPPQILLLTSQAATVSFRKWIYGN